MRSEKRNGHTPVKKSKAAKRRQFLFHQNQSRLSVIIEVKKDHRTLKRVLRQAERLRPKELLLIVHDSNDLSLEIVLSHPWRNLTTYVYPFPLGPDVWRAIGAREAKGDVLLFLDAGRVVAAKELLPFVQACYRGVDVAVRKARALRNRGKRTPTLTLAKAYLNSLLAQPVGKSSLIDLPFAMRREAVLQIGAEHLLIPPLAYAMAVVNGLRVEHTCQVRGVRAAPLKKQRPKERMKREKRDSVHLGDHLEALQYVADSGVLQSRQHEKNF